MTRRLILVTGGAGFIGSNIVAQLCEAGMWDVAVCDRFGDSELGKWRNIAKHPVADLVAPEALADWLSVHGDALEAVIHMGAISSTTEPDVDKIVQANFVLSRDLWRVCTEKSVRLIYASSAATYGDGADGFHGRDDPESLAKLRPLNAYGWSKAMFDLYAARNAARNRKPPQWVGLKFFNVYGPNEYHKGTMKSVVAQIWPQVVGGEPVRLFKSYNTDYADGGQLRDFVYVRDAAEVVAWLIATPGVEGIYNLGSGQARSFLDLAKATCAAAGRVCEVEYTDMPDTLQDRYQYFTEANIKRLKTKGYSGNFTSLERGVADYVGRYLSSCDPYR
jgi:ADP-L-glycero-D-manno-heptose 6-epimerase